MRKYEIISLDMFQTLVDVNKRIPEIWQGILGEEYTEEKAKFGAKAILGNLTEAYQNGIAPFQTMEEVYIECAKMAVRETGFGVTPENIVTKLMYQHGMAPFYEETLSVLEALAKEYTVIISSDASHIMVDPILEKLKVDKVFISDDLCSYKGDPSGKFFEKVLEEMKASPEKVLHIGDSAMDVVGANAVHIKSCWLNRSGRQWTRNVQPDYEIGNLKDIFTIL